MAQVARCCLLLRQFYPEQLLVVAYTCQYRTKRSPALSALTVPLTSSLMRPSRMANTKVPNRNTALSTSALAGGSSNRTAPRAGTLRPGSRPKAGVTVRLDRPALGAFQ